jgi:hypothetical protein
MLSCPRCGSSLVFPDGAGMSCIACGELWPATSFPKSSASIDLAAPRKCRGCSAELSDNQRVWCGRHCAARVYMRERRRKRAEGEEPVAERPKSTMLFWEML